MPTTRSATGHSAPRIVQQIEAAVTPGTTKKRTTKANTSKPRDKTVASGRVGKAAAPKKSTTTTTKTTKKKSPVKKVVDKVAGKTEKAVGEVEGKPGKKAAGEKKSKSTTTSKVATTKTKGKVIA